MKHFAVRRCTREDEAKITDICYRTGYMGENLTGKKIFNDKKLFGLLFCSYYLRYETENCFVVIDKRNNNTAGYIIGTMDSRKQLKNFELKMVWRIAIRLFFHTLWVHPESFKCTMGFLFNLDMKDEPENLHDEFPAHLHINISPEYQRSGIGTLLMDAFEKHIRDNSVKGIHLRTSNYNKKALAFYEKRGYTLLYEKEGRAWPGIKKYKNIILDKKLK